MADDSACAEPDEDEAPAVVTDVTNTAVAEEMSTFLAKLKRCGEWVGLSALSFLFGFPHPGPGLVRHTTPQCIAHETCLLVDRFDELLSPMSCPLQCHRVSDKRKRREAGDKSFG